MRILLAALALLTGCGVTIPEQKLAEGESGCQTVTTIYGSVSTLRSRVDNAPKGTSATTKQRMTCGSALLETDGTVSQPVPPPSQPHSTGGANASKP